MQIKQLTLAGLKKNRIEIQKKEAAIAAEQKFNLMIREIAKEIYPRDLFMRDKNVAKADYGETITEKIQGYMGKLEISDSVFAPWARIR